MAELAAIYVHLIGARIRAQMQYRLSFLLEIAGAFLLTFTDFIAVLVIFHQLPRLGDWTLPEVAFLYGTSYVTFKVTDMAIGHLDSLGQLIEAGQFDMIMVRPLGTLFQIATLDFALRQIGALLQGAFVLTFSLSRLHIHWTLGKALVLAVMPLSGALIFASVWIVGHTLAFWTTRGGEAVSAFTYGGSMLTSYPIDIFGTWLRRLLAFVIPLAFVNYLPSLFILDKPDPLGLPRVLQFLSPVVAALAAFVAANMWSIGVRHYRSTGS